MDADADDRCVLVGTVRARGKPGRVVLGWCRLASSEGKASAEPVAEAFDLVLPPI